MWGWDITNFVFWIGIGHAGTLISAILFLTRQNWRTSINRAAEAMTIFAVMCAGIFPAFHVGRVWMAWYLAPIPNANADLAELQEPAAVGRVRRLHLLHRLADLLVHRHGPRPRHHARPRHHQNPQIAYGILALGWRGGNRQWRHYEMAYLLLAALSTPLVLSVPLGGLVRLRDLGRARLAHHDFPALLRRRRDFGGFAMVLTLMIPARKIFGLEDLITMKHIDNMAKIILLTGCFVGYAYCMEFFIAWYGANPFERDAFYCASSTARTTGPTTP
jgi:hypothetical protein